MFANSIDIVAVRRRIADDKIELPLALQNLRGYRSAHGRLNDRVDISGVETIAGGFGAIYFDVQIGLPQYREDAKVADAAHLVHLIADLLGQLRQDFEIGADDFDRIDAFDARDSFFDVVLNVLREIEDDSGQLVVELGLYLLG